MKKVIVAFIAALLVVTSITPVSAAAVPPTAETQDIPSPLAEQTEWYVRIHNGKLQKRLWSITYSRWLTDWIDVG